MIRFRRQCASFLAMPMTSLTTNSQGGGLNAMNWRVFAVKVLLHIQSRQPYLSYRVPQAEQNKFLDVARETYKENVQDIQQFKTELVQQYDLPLELNFTESGYSFSIRKSELTGDLPGEFRNKTSRGQRWVFSSIELVSCRFAGGGVWVGWG